MSAFSVQAPRRFPPAAPPLRFGRTLEPSGDGSVQWLLKRNCSITPRQLLAFFSTLCAVSFAIASAFWWRGAPLVLPFAGVEITAVALALLVYARHAADREWMVLRPGVLCVECTVGRRTDRVEFQPAWVRIEPQSGDRSLIELSGQGKRVAIGRFVRPELRRALADELRGTLRRFGSTGAPSQAGTVAPAHRHEESES